MKVPSRLLWYSWAAPCQVVEEQVGIAVVVEVDPGATLAELGWRRLARPALAATSSNVPSPRL